MRIQNPHHAGNALGIHAEADHGGKAFQLVHGQQNITVYEGLNSEENRPLEIDNLPPASEADPLELGVHRSLVQNGNAVPSYVTRDSDGDIDSRLQEAADLGGLVLIVGESTAGKSRAAYEAMLRVLPEFRFFVPASRADLCRIANVKTSADNRCLVWLEDLDRFLSPDGLTPALLRSAVASGVVLLATMRSENYRLYQPGSTLPAQQDSLTVADLVRMGKLLLNQVEPVILDRKWSSVEVSRAKKSADGRVLDAASHSEKFGVSEYLAAGPQLLREYTMASAVDGNPRGASIVRAAIDCARAGLSGSIPENLLKAVHEHYLESAGGSILRPESLEDAFAWAMRRRHGVTSLLLPGRRPNYYRPFDYLVDSASRNPSEPPVPNSTWKLVLDYASRRKSLLFAVGIAAHLNSNPAIAERALKQVAESGGIHAALHLGLLCAELGRHEDAEEWFTRATADGDALAHCMYGEYLQTQFRFDEAKRNFEESLRLGHDHARINLANTQSQLGDKQSAEENYKEAFKLGKLEAAGWLGKFFEDQGRPVQAEEWYRRGASNGWTACLLGDFLVRQKKVDQALEIFHASLAAGHDHAASEIGHIYRTQGDDEKAEQWYRIGAMKFDPAGMCCLAYFAWRKGNKREAETLFNRSLKAGHVHAGVQHGYLLEEEDRFEEAVALYTTSAELGSPDAACQLGHALVRRGEVSDAIPWLQKAVVRGHGEAGCPLGWVMQQAGDFEAAENAYRAAIASGHEHAREKLASMLARRGRGLEASKVLKARDQSKAKRTSSRRNRKRRR